MMETNVRSPTLETGNITVLIVDNLAHIRQGIKTLLQLTDDFQIVGEAANGVEAVQMAERFRPDIVIMDLKMPGMDGFEAIRQIKSRNLAMGVIALTLYDDRRNRERAAYAGADAFIEKDAAVDTLEKRYEKFTKPFNISINPRRIAMTTLSIRVANTDMPVSAKAGVKSRMVYLDKLKVMLTVLVIAHHAGQAYGPTGGQWPIFSLERSALLGPFFTVNAAFFMGLFFLISGYFVPRTFDRKGTITFLKGRFRRLGIPLLLFGLLVTGPMLYFSQDDPGSFRQFINHVYPNEIPTLFAHMWFVAHLLVYAIGYALWRQLTQRSSFTNRIKLSVPTHQTILAYVLVLTIVTAVVRVWYPIDRWVTLLVVPAEIAHLPQYVSLFVIGILAYRGDWLRRLPTTTGMAWLGIGLVAAVARYAIALPGGWNLFPSIVTTSEPFWSLWEAVICVGFCVGLLVLFREWGNGQQGKLLLPMAGAAYAAYIIHLLVVIGIQFGLDTVTLTPFTKFALVALLGTILSFGIAHLALQLPGAKKIL